MAQGKRRLSAEHAWPSLPSEHVGRCAELPLWPDRAGLRSGSSRGYDSIGALAMVPRQGLDLQAKQ